MKATGRDAHGDGHVTVNLLSYIKGFYDFNRAGEQFHKADYNATNIPACKHSASSVSEVYLSLSSDLSSVSAASRHSLEER